MQCASPKAFVVVSVLVVVVVVVAIVTPLGHVVFWAFVLTVAARSCMPLALVL